MTIKPLRDTIFIKADEQKDETPSGIVITKAVKETPVFGEVVYIGPDVKGIQVGNRVMFKKYVPDKVEIEGDPFFVCAEDAILAVLSDA